MFNMNPNAQRDALLIQWQEAKKTLDAAKEIEMQLRKRVVTEVYNFSENELREGTENVELGNGFKLKAVFKTSYTLNNKDNAVDKMLCKLEASGPEGKFIAERLVKFKPELSVAEYKRLDTKERRIADLVISTKPAAPTLEIVAPKA